MTHGWDTLVKGMGHFPGGMELDGMEFHPVTQNGVQFKTYELRSSCCGPVVMNPTNIHGVASLIPGLAQWVKDPVLP